MFYSLLLILRRNHCYFETACIYHTELKCLARENLLSKEIAALIPRSNIWRWKNELVPQLKHQTIKISWNCRRCCELRVTGWKGVDGNIFKEPNEHF